MPGTPASDQTYTLTATTLPIQPILDLLDAIEFHETELSKIHIKDARKAYKRDITNIAYERVYMGLYNLFKEHFSNDSEIRYYTPVILSLIMMMHRHLDSDISEFTLLAEFHECFRQSKTSHLLGINNVLDGTIQSLTELPSDKKNWPFIYEHFLKNERIKYYFTQLGFTEDSTPETISKLAQVVSSINDLRSKILAPSSNPKNLDIYKPAQYLPGFTKEHRIEQCGKFLCGFTSIAACGGTTAAFCLLGFAKPFIPLIVGGYTAATGTSVASNLFHTRLETQKKALQVVDDKDRQATASQLIDRITTCFGEAIPISQQPEPTTDTETTYLLQSQVCSN